VTTFTVTDCSTDSQLQDAISHATDGDTITFACAGTITLTSTLTLKRKGQTAGNLTLDGSGESVILDGGNNVRVLLVDGMHLTLKGLTLANGKTDESGGGLYISRSGEVTIDNALFCGNTARHGGGLCNDGGKVTMTNCTIWGNTASAWGGGLYNNFGGEATISFCTFVNNTATIAGGLTTGYPSLRITATIVANNSAHHSKQQNGAGKMTSLGFNLESGTDCDLTPMPTDQHNLDPALDPTGLQNNGGSTQTIALQVGSPAIGAIPNQMCPPIDQRGYLRPAGHSFCDIGACQSSYLAPPASPPLIQAGTQTPP
jgi:parallel beta helix pectate lyase-like protein